MKFSIKFIVLALWLCLPAMLSAQKKVKIPREKDMGAYLMVYFKDETHGLYFALSKDGYSYTDVNQARPVIAGDTIAEQKGIRDPYIYRGTDGLFYVVLTDLHIYAQKAGYRTTEWERDGRQYGWGNNRGLVIMKSADLVHWSHYVLRVDKAFPGLEEIGCAWAPEVIYDPVKKLPMLYFTMRFGTGREKVYYTYMSESFDKMLTPPKVIFEYPRNFAYIDADITKVGNKYHMFYASHDGTSGVKQAVSDSINTGYQFDDRWYDPEPKGCEAPTVYKLIGQNKWILCYDIYRITPNNFGFSETSDFVNFKDLGHFNEGVMKATNFVQPKHAAFIQLTKKEARLLAAVWHLYMKF